MYGLEEEIRFGIEGSFVIMCMVMAVVFSLFSYNKILRRFQPKREVTMKRRYKAVLSCFFLGLFLRGYWMLACIRPGKWDFYYSAAQAAINRFAVCAFFLGFVIIVFEWDALWNTLKLRSASERKRLGQGCSILVFCLVVVQLIYIMLTFFEEVAAQRHQEFGPDNVAINGLFFVFALGFYAHGSRFAKELQVAGGQSSVFAKARATLKQVQHMALICTVCYCVRVILFIFGSLIYFWEVIPTHSHVTDIDYFFYPTFYYTIPDVIPTLALLHIMTPNRGRKPKDMETSKEMAVFPIVNGEAKAEKRQVDSPSLSNQKQGIIGNRNMTSDGYDDEDSISHDNDKDLRSKYGNKSQHRIEEDVDTYIKQPEDLRENSISSRSSPGSYRSGSTFSFSENPFSDNEYRNENVQPARSIAKNKNTRKPRGDSPRRTY